MGAIVVRTLGAMRGVASDTMPGPAWGNPVPERVVVEEDANASWVSGAVEFVLLLRRASLTDEGVAVEFPTVP